MIADCCGSKTGVLLLSCSGGSNVGQLSNRAAVELAQEGFGSMSCLAGIGGRLEGFVQKAKAAATVAVIDGCAVGCGKAIMANAGIEKYDRIVLTDLGIEKNKNMNLADEDVANVKSAVRSACGGNSKPETEPDTKAAATGRCCG